MMLHGPSLMLEIERPDSIPRLEYPSPKLGLGLESENLWTRDPNKSKITAKKGKNYRFWTFKKINLLSNHLLRIDFMITMTYFLESFNQIEHNCSNLHLNFIIWAQNG